MSIAWESTFNGPTETYNYICGRGVLFSFKNYMCQAVEFLISESLFSDYVRLEFLLFNTKQDKQNIITTYL